MAPTVFNLEISRSGSYVPHCILNWVISKMDWVKIWYWDFEQLTSSKLSQGYYSFYAFHSFDSFTIVNSQITSTWRLAMQVVQLYEIAKMKRYLKNHWPILNKRWQKKTIKQLNCHFLSRQEMNLAFVVISQWNENTAIKLFDIPWVHRKAPHPPYLDIDIVGLQQAAKHWTFSPLPMLGPRIPPIPIAHCPKEKLRNHCFR